MRTMRGKAIFWYNCRARSCHSGGRGRSAAGSAGKEGESPREKERDRGGERRVEVPWSSTGMAQSQFLREPDESGRPVLLEAVKIPNLLEKTRFKSKNA